LAIAFLDFIEALERSLELEVKGVGTFLVVVVLSDLEVARAVKV
jgi:hypothetical protein